MSFPQFVAFPGDQVTICAQNQIMNGQIKYATGTQVIRERPDGELRICTNSRYQVDVNGVLYETFNYNTYTFSLEDVKRWFTEGILTTRSVKELHEIGVMVKYALRITPSTQQSEFDLLARLLWITEDYIVEAPKSTASHDPRRA